jgi:hypothetical protein
MIPPDAINHWPCLKRWSNEYLLEKMGDRRVTIDGTSFLQSNTFESDK